MNVNVLVLLAPPQAFDKHVVQRSTFAVHADAHACRLQPACEQSTRGLNPLVGIEDLTDIITESCFLVGVFFCFVLFFFFWFFLFFLFFLSDYRT